MSSPRSAPRSSSRSSRSPRSSGGSPSSPSSALLDGLNPEQQRAVETTEGPVLVLAGAGTGKTRVVTRRIARLLERRVSPESVLAMTFTNKAAGEMRERIAGLVGKRRAERVVAGTFHRFCLDVLREHGARVGLSPRFSICDPGDQLASAKAALRELRVPEAAMRPSALLGRISLEKSRLRTPGDVLGEPGDERDELVGRAWRRYEERLGARGAVDFDDLLLLALRLLREHADVRDALRERHRYVLVDEYQDTNAPQYEILRALCDEHRNLCVVGDDDQSIYGWRGADVRRILSFERDFPGAVVVRLETNYRSTEEILDCAWKLIRCNADRHEKRLRSALGRGDRVRAYQLEDEDEEARFVVHEIQRAVRDREASLRDFAILVRTQVQPRPFEAELRARGVPYRLVGGRSFFDRKEVRDVLAYLRLCAHPDDEEAFLRVLNAPPRGVGKVSVEKLLARATEAGVPLPRVLDRPEDVPGLAPAAARAAGDLRKLVRTLAAEDPGAGLVRHVERVLEAVSYRAEVERRYPDPKERSERWAGVDEVLNLAASHVRRAKRPSLAAFLSEVALVADDRRDDDGDRGDQVTIMTLHAAKGLEFPRVFLVGLEEGLLPHLRAAADGAVDEERRLAYVGITRAQRWLAMTWTKARARQGRSVPTSTSRFLYEMKGERPPKGWVPAGEPAPPPAPRKRKARRRASPRR